MTHIPPPPAGENAVCPNCNTKFGYVVIDDKVTCPLCKTVQELPVVMTGDMEYHCFDCRMDFSASDSNPRCPVCNNIWKESPLVS